MKSLKKYPSFFEMAPTLIKEWHPTANGKLSPRDLGIDYPQKVWWLCSEGHEWQATVESRMNGNNCPICKNEGEIKTADANKIDAQIGADYRKNRRYSVKALAVVQIPGSGHWLYAELKNYSSQGLCFETDAAMTPGSKITIKFNKTLVSSKLDKSYLSSNKEGYRTYNSIVKWCKKLDDAQSISNFAVGVKLF